MEYFMAYFLYKVFDKNKQLLYVGFTNNISRRFSQHKGKEWFKLMASFESIPFATEIECKEAEEDCIKEQNPVYNLQHTESKANTKDKTFRQRGIYFSDQVMLRLKFINAQTNEGISKIVERILDKHLPEFNELKVIELAPTS